MRAAALHRLDVRLPAEAASIPVLRHKIVAFAAEHGVADPPAVGLAVTEAATNAVLHAYPEGESGDVRLVACLERTQLVVVVRDWGPGMRPRADSPGLGIGLPTIATLAGSLELEAADGTGTLLRMRFPRAA
jgi:anti-sigma regulatory factor (Ser/Thr protein kinase)